MSYDLGFIDGAEDAQFGIELTIDELIEDGYSISFILGYADGVAFELEAA